MKYIRTILDELDKGEAKYDEHCKLILSQPIIFSYFIKHCFKDFVHLNVIVKECEKNLPITGKEDTLISGSKIIYDVFANLSLPNNEGKIKGVFFNGEHQNKSNPGYFMYQRANYYNSRIESSEKGVIFKNSHFKDLQKVYVFWIMMDHARYLDGVMNRVFNEEESLGKEYYFPKESYDDRETVLLYPKRDYDYEGDLGNEFEHALAFANLLFSENISASKKKYYLKKRFHIPVDDELEKGIDSMCNLGFQQSCIKYKASLEALMNKTSWPLEEAMDAIAIPERYRPILYERFAEEEAYYKEHEGCSN